MAAHRYWRLLFTASDNPAGVQLAEVVFKSNGADVTVNGTANASSYWTDGTYAFLPAMAFDKILTSDWATASGAALPQWLSYDFGVAVNIDAFSITSSQQGVEHPTAWQLQYSDDGTNWTTAQSYSFSSWTTAQTTQSFTNLVPLIDTETASPNSAPAGTVRTITITAHDPNTPVEALASASLVRSDGGAVTPVSGQPPGTFKWTTTI